jgi:hypothetical protein
MTEDENLKATIGDEPLVCDNGEDALVLQPVGGILCDNSTEGYRLEELDQMVSTLSRYDRPQELAQLRKLVADRRSAEKSP